MPADLPEPDVLAREAKGELEAALGELDAFVKGFGRGGVDLVCQLHGFKQSLEMYCSRLWVVELQANRTRSYYQGNIPWMSVKDMNKNVLNDTVDYISEEAVRNSSTNIIPRVRRLLPPE